jgi:hypothetical protein
MKKLTLLFAGLLITVLLLAQSDRYVNAMKANISKLDSAMMKGNMSELANNFERIADAEKTQWLPYYYAAYATVMQAFLEQDKTKSDGIADKAEQLIAKAEALAGKENSETFVIRSMIASAHMMVDPQTRWQKYGEASSTNIAKAKASDPSNPRPVYLDGQAKLFTPESFGGGKAPAKELFEKALAMFNEFKPASELHPAWGKAATQYFLSQAQ